MQRKETHMAESIPLRATLRVQRVAVIVRDILCKRFDRVLECLTAEGWLLRHGERKTDPFMSRKAQTVIFD